MEANGGDGAVALEQAPVVDSTLVSTLNDNADAPDQQPQLTESAQEETTEAVNELQSPPPPTAADSKPEESDEDQSVEAGGEASGVEAKTDEMKEVQQEAAEGVDTPVPTETETADDTTTPATEQDSGIQDEQEVNESAMDIENNSGDAGEDKEVPLESNGGLSPPAHDDDEYDPSAPTHDDDEYDPSMPTIDTSSVPHGEDEYDPANPSPAGTPVAGKTQTDNASVEPTAEREEYDPDHPSMSAAAAEEPVAMEVDHSTASADQASVTPAKRKADEETAASTEVPSNGRNDKNEPKRPRNDDSDKTSPRGHEEHKNHHRGHGESSSPSSRKHRNHEEDHKGLSPAAWDRLMDFQAGSEFRVTQVSRAAFASVGAMPEFAQIAIIARFVRTPLQEVRDKNGQLMRIYREYQKENPQVAALQPVDAFISDYKTDPGLFRFGYAPPQPTTGISNVRIPYQRDHKLNENTAPKKSSQQAGNSTAKQTEQQQDKDVDEFGRALHHDKATIHVVDSHLHRAVLHMVQLFANHVHSLVANGTLASVEELGGKCYEVLNQLSEPLANQVLVRFAGANLSNVRNRSGFLIGVVKRCRQEYGFNN
ncbi:hypothetical protein PHYBOEH_004037 [Phytophthora boehmeriae]|uniref:Heterogeneous nuclear ribonucleoprotein Q acidic domain-containing protein n=1 Tax=Phytophthora boehmeriae TaxID=109152 RepID=A0A8T1WMK1_9STRA|nr:hypothetical protein PHYBOEH_004037 [Phytophthora boehmeriae]